MAKETKKAAKERSDALVMKYRTIQDAYYRKYDLHMTPEQIADETGISADRVREHEAGNYDEEVHKALPEIWQRRRGVI